MAPFLDGRCTLALRETVELPDKSEFTWVEIFLLMNIVFQGLVLVLSFCDYSTALAQLTSKTLRVSPPLAAVG